MIISLSVTSYVVWDNIRIMMHNTSIFTIAVSALRTIVLRLPWSPAIIPPWQFKVDQVHFQTAITLT